MRRSIGSRPGRSCGSLDDGLNGVITFRRFKMGLVGLVLHRNPDAYPVDPKAVQAWRQAHCLVYYWPECECTGRVG